MCPPCDGLVTFHLPHLNLMLVKGFVAGSSRKFASLSSRPSLQGAYSRLSWESLGEHLGPPFPLSSTPTCSSACVAVTPSDQRDSLWFFPGGLTDCSTEHMLGTANARGNMAHSWFDWALAFIGQVSVISAQGAGTHTLTTLAWRETDWKLQNLNTKSEAHNRHTDKPADGWIQAPRQFPTLMFVIRHRNLFIHLVS